MSAIVDSHQHFWSLSTAGHEHGMLLDALFQPRHLPMLARFLERGPDIPVVIDHCAKPFAPRGERNPRRADIAALAERGAYCKLSGLRTEQTRGQSAEALRPYVEHVAACFGERLIGGSNWPVLLLSGDSYGQWLEDAARLSGVTGPGRDRLFHGAANEFNNMGG